MLHAPKVRLILVATSRVPIAPLRSEPPEELEGVQLAELHGLWLAQTAWQRRRSGRRGLARRVCRVRRGGSAVRVCLPRGRQTLQPADDLADLEADLAHLGAISAEEIAQLGRRDRDLAELGAISADEIADLGLG